MNKKVLVFIFVVILFLLTACTPSIEELNLAVEGTLDAYTPIPTSTAYATQTPYSTYTPYPTSTKQPTIMVTRIVIRTPTPKDKRDRCKPITNMDYSNLTNSIIMLQAYVASLPDVRSVSYTINERLYSNTLSHLIHVTYISSSDGQVYSRRYIVYVNEFNWSKAVFSIDGQCFVDGPHR